MSLRYPSDGFSGNGDFVTFKPVKYKSRGSGGGGGGGYITMYMPESLPAVSNVNQWGQFSPGTGLIGQAKLDFIGGIAEGGYGIDFTKPMNEDQKAKTRDMFRNYFENIGNNAQAGIKEGAIKGLSGMMNMQPNQVMSVTQGTIYNPNIELAYEGPQFRSFGFSFNMIPKSGGDASTINQIIREFKRYSAPEAISGGMYEIPYVWEISYMGPASGYMNKFKPAACTSVTVQDNAGINFYAAHKDGAPVQTTLSVTFMECDVITRKDHSGARGM